jgi:uncharacterized protein YbaP (TraB family)
MIRLLRRGLAALAFLTSLVFALPAAAEPALWVVKDANSTIYLFGTIHYLRPDLDWRSPKIDQAFARSADLTLEVPDLDDPAAMQPLVAKYGLDRAHPLSTKILPKDEPRLAAAAKSLGLSRAALEPMRPWLVGLTVSVLPAVKAGYDPNSGVELVLTREAKAAGKPIGALETIEQQVHFLADLSPAQQVQFLKQSLDDIDHAVTEIDSMVSAWREGDTAALEKQFVEGTKRDYPGIYRVLVVQRNVRWAQELKAKLAGSGVSFVAVGAGHLVGPDSLQAQLEKLGIRTERVN